MKKACVIWVANRKLQRNVDDVFIERLDLRTEHFHFGGEQKPSPEACARPLGRLLRILDQPA